MFNNKSRLIPLIAVLVLVLGLFAYFTMGNNAKNSDSKSNSTTNSNSSNQSSQSQLSTVSSNQSSQAEKLDITKAVGSYSGTGTILTSSLVFPKTTFTLTADSKFVLDAKGLDLALLNDEALKVQGQFPVAGVKVNGTALPKADGTVDMRATAVSPMFTVGGQVLPESATPQILEGLKKYGIILPVVSETQPLIVATEVEKQDTKLVINNLPDSNFVVKFSGNPSTSSSAN